MDKTFRTLLALFIVVAAILIGIVIVAVGNTNRAIRAATWVNHTHAYITEIDHALGALREAEGAVNAFLLSSDAGNQAIYRRAFGELAEHLAVAKALADDDELESKAIAALERSLLQRAERARELIAAHRSQDQSQLDALLSNDAEGLATMEISQMAQTIRVRQTNLLTERDQIAFNQDQVARNTVYLGAFFTLLILAGTFWFIRDDLAARRRANQLLAETNEQLESKVKERTAELEGANKNLRAENLESRWSNQALEHQLRYDGLIINSLSEPIIVITKALKVSRINPATLRATQRDNVELVDHPISDFIKLTPLPNETNPSTDPLAEALQYGFDLRDRQATLQVAGQPDQPIHINLFPLRDRDVVVGGVVTLYLNRAHSA
jgi:CHASE3 domain sensor protein